MVTMATGIELNISKTRPIQYHVVLWSIPILTWVLVIGVFLANRAQMVTLLQVEDPIRLNQVVQQLDFHNIEYEIAHRGIIRVSQSQRTGAVLLLVQKGLFFAGGSLSSRLISPSDGSLLSDAQNRETLQYGLASVIGAMSGEITGARVKIQDVPPENLSNSPVGPLVSVKLIGRGSFPRDLIQKVQAVVSACLPTLKPGEIVIIDEQNKILSAGPSSIRLDELDRESQGNG